MNTIAEGWEKLVKEILPENVSPLQYREMRRSFYAGAALMHVMMTSTGDDGVSEDAAVALIQGWAEEIELFSEQILARKA